MRRFSALGLLPLVLLALPATAQFHPLDLSPDHLLESVVSYSNPWSTADCTGTDAPVWDCTGSGTGDCTGTDEQLNSACTGSGAPYPCCTGSGTGTCPSVCVADNLVTPVASFYLVNCKTRNIDCVGAGDPNACCTGAGTGTCCYEQGDQGWGINGYCPDRCADGCVWQWRDSTQQIQDGTNSTTPAPNGRSAEQDDLEKPCYVADCTPTGLPCVEGGSAWDEPTYDDASCVGVDDPWDCCTAAGVGPCDPYQDSTLELEPGDRDVPIHHTGGGCGEEWYQAGLYYIDPATQPVASAGGLVNQTHWLGWARLRWDTTAGDEKLAFVETATSVQLTTTGVDHFSAAGWYYVEVRRNGSDQLQTWINGAEVTASPTPTYTGTSGTGNKWFCFDKQCDGTADTENFTGRIAFMFYKCLFANASCTAEANPRSCCTGPGTGNCGAISDANRASLWDDYVQETYLEVAGAGTGAVFSAAVLSGLEVH